VAWCCSACPHDLQVMIMSSAHMSYWRHGNAQTCLGNTRALLHAVAAKPSFISVAHGLWRSMEHVSALEPTSKAGAVRSQRTRVSARPLLNGEARSVPDPSWMVKRGSGASGHVVVPEPTLSREAGSVLWWHVATCGCIPCLLSWPEARTRGVPGL
jgi:hypothetical protein